MKAVLLTFRDLRRFAMIGTLAATLLVSLAACGGAADAPTGGSAPGATATAAAASDDGMDMGTMTPDTAPAAGDAAPTQAAATDANSAANAVEVQATLREWALDLNTKEVPAGAVRFVITNAGQFAHNFTIKDANGAELAKTPNFSAAKGPQTVEVTLTPGTYTVFCSLPGHAQRGQQNTLVVK